MAKKAGMNDFRNVDRNGYPELAGYSDEGVYDGFIGCGGLYLATNMVRRMNLKKGDIVLDLGCGFGSSSIFLAQKYDVTVVAVDLWTSSTVLLHRFEATGVSGNIIPLNFDITQTIPFADGYFDAIFCMNSLFMYGGSVSFLKKLLKTLKYGGTFCIGSECFNQEPEWACADEVPMEFNFNWSWEVWESCGAKYHSPKWWQELLLRTEMLDIEWCNELEDATILYEDMALSYDRYFGKEILSMGSMIPQQRIIDQLLYGRKHTLAPSLFVLSGKRK